MLKLNDLLRQISSVQRSGSFQRATSNAIYNVADTVAMPILMVAATPFWVHRLGLDQYGIWMLVNSLSGAMGVLSVGLGDATVRYVSKFRGKQDLTGVVRSVHASVTLSTLLGAGTISLVFISAPLLVHHVFKIDPKDYDLVIRALRIGGLAMGIRGVEGVLLSVLRGFERYDVAAKIAIASKTTAIGVAVALTALGYGVLALLIGTTLVTWLGMVAEGIAARRIVSGLSLLPHFNLVAMKEVAGFGFYSWLQSVAAAIFSQADRLLIGGLLGTREVGIYTICAQLAQQIHSITAAALNFIFPLFSRCHEGGSSESLKPMYRLSLLANLAITSALSLPLILFGKWILRVYMGANFVPMGGAILLILAIAFGLLSLNVVPHYTLLGLAHVRFVAVTNIAAGAFSLLGAWVLIPWLGLNGAAVGKLFYAPVISLNFFKVTKVLRRLGLVPIQE